MIELTTEIDSNARKTAKLARRSLPGFQYQNGYSFSATDLGNNGVKIELFHENDVASAIIIPTGAVGEFGKWLLDTLGQDQHGFPNELPDILRRLCKYKRPVFKRGDKKRLKDTIRALRK